jgi:hypothetical protein
MFKKGVPPYMPMIVVVATKMGYYETDDQEERSYILDIAMNQVFAMVDEIRNNTNRRLDEIENNALKNYLQQINE